VKLMNVIGLCGSLRASSTNRSLLQAAQALAPTNLCISSIVDGTVVSHFNPELEPHVPPEAADWRSLAGTADGIILSTPEYAAGIPGAFKNALDWLVGEPRVYMKPVAIFSASERSLGAKDALRLTLTTMSLDIIEPASICLPLLGRTVTADEVASDYRGEISGALAAFADEIAGRGLKSTVA